MFDLSNKCVVVTGGGRGIGRGISLAMAQAGADIVLTGRHQDVLESAANEVRDIGRRAIPVVSDITSPADIERIKDTALEAFGYIDCWVNNAGSADPRDVGRMIDITPDQWDHVVDLNFKWTFFAMQAAARAMTRGGSIINLSSRTASQPCPKTGHYGAAKAGVESLTGTLAVEWGHLGIRVNAIAPGLVPTERSSVAGSPSRQRRQLETVPLRRLGRVEDVAALAVYFASDESEWVSGQVVHVAGGSRIPIGLLSYLYQINQEMSQREAQNARS